jgi:hypothetical protein
MRARSRLLIGFLLLIVLALALFFFFRPQEGQAAYGPAAALCPGPDQFGYTCASADGFAYLDATQDTGLYLDDGLVEVTLPFAFNFYGTTYTRLWASSNGFLRFDSGAAPYMNECLSSGPVTGLGDMIAPYWDDLDLTEYGYLETAVFGAAPARVFVVEWDNVPYHGSDEGLSFAVHLFEGSNDIVFLYEDVTTAGESNGRSATIGLQSEAAGISLQYSCDQASVSDASGRHFPYPAAPNPAVTLPHQSVPGADHPLPTTTISAKGEVATLLNALNQQGLTAVAQLQRHWLSQTPPRMSEWARVDLDGNGREELILLWRGPAQHPELSQLVVLTPDEAGQMRLWLDHRFAARTGPTPQFTLGKVTDLTGDNQPDLLLIGQNDDTDAHRVLTAVGDKLHLLSLSQISSCQDRTKTIPCTP